VQDHCAIYDVARDHPEVCSLRGRDLLQGARQRRPLSRRETLAGGSTACVCCVRPCRRKLADQHDAARRHHPRSARLRRHPAGWNRPGHRDTHRPTPHREETTSEPDRDRPSGQRRPPEPAGRRQDLAEYKFGWSDGDDGYAFTSERGLTARGRRGHQRPQERAQLDARPAAARLRRLRASPDAQLGSDLSGIDFDDIYYYVEASEKQANTWEELPPEILETYEKLGIPQAERERLIAGVAAQYESTVLYHKVREDLEEQGVIFLDTDTALHEHEDLFREHFATIIPPNDNKFAALNTAVWSGGSFIWIPEGVKVDIPLQAYFRINKQNMGQFERTLIIAEPGSYVHYVEGCTAPIYSSDSLHSAVVEIIVKEGARVRYTTIQNWSNNVYNLVTKRAVAEKNATMEWIDGNIGSKVTMKYPAVWLTGEGAKGEVLSVAYANDGQHQDAGAKMVHAAPYTTSNILSKSISKGTGPHQLPRPGPDQRGRPPRPLGGQVRRADARRHLADRHLPVHGDRAGGRHDRARGHGLKLSDDQLFYMQSRGIDEDEATAMIVRGFIEPIARELPMEYSVELNRLIALEMEGAIG
jgi:Fe-S cluster assembly protein SufB